MYHLMSPAKYREALCDEQVAEVLKVVCLELASTIIGFLGRPAQLTIGE